MKIMKMHFIKKNMVILAASTLVVLSVLAIMFAVHLYTSYQPTAAFNPTDSKAILIKAGQLVHLPDNETPTIAPVGDLSRLKKQPFFNFAKEGDLLIVYAENQLAVLYDPKNNKIVNMSKISVTRNPAAL